jgi:hypothetical protein
MELSTPSNVRSKEVAQSSSRCCLISRPALLGKLRYSSAKDESKRSDVDTCEFIVLTEEHTSKSSNRSATGVLPFFWQRSITTGRLRVPIRGLNTAKSPEKAFNASDGNRSRAFFSALPNQQQAVSTKSNAGLPLSRKLVMALEQAIAGPFYTRRLADLGARVRKIVRPGRSNFNRDHDTRVRGLCSYFVWTNRSR